MLDDENTLLLIKTAVPNSTFNDSNPLYTNHSINDEDVYEVMSTQLLNLTFSFLVFNLICNF